MHIMYSSKIIIFNRIRRRFCHLRSCVRSGTPPCRALFGPGVLTFLVGSLDMAAFVASLRPHWLLVGFVFIMVVLGSSLPGVQGSLHWLWFRGALCFAFFAVVALWSRLMCFDKRAHTDHILSHILVMAGHGFIALPAGIKLYVGS